MRKLNGFLFRILMITNLFLTSCTTSSLEEESEMQVTEGDKNGVIVEPDDN
ncbi:hypothetical protein Q4Q34_04180 [Flavivirga abyssicola]|uniref:hypothetical protein n=1 Tax=Flavivirga abyssicola TaxID=3063533 RepID=UPI002ED39758|nr:hypothetical protein Q4Q34_04180 [Flavivirga sp. MEBiC07777]